MTTNAQLRALMKERGLTNKDVAGLLGLPVDPRRYQSSTVQHWIGDRRTMPGPMLELLRLKLPPR